MTETRMGTRNVDFKRLGINDYEIGERVVISKESYKNIYNGNRSIHCFPDDKYLNIAKSLCENNVKGTVTMKFPPGYEVNVTFDDGNILQVKDHWVERY